MKYDISQLKVDIKQISSCLCAHGDEAFQHLLKYLEELEERIEELERELEELKELVGG